MIRAGCRGTLALALLLIARDAQAGEFEAAQKAARELRFAEARTHLGAALKIPGHSAAELAEMLALSGELAALLDGAEAGEQEFRKLLVLDPGHAPPKLGSPVYRVPFERARRWANQHGPLTVEHTPPARARAGRPTPLEIRVARDPLDMIAGLRLSWRLSTDENWAQVRGDKLGLALPPAEAGDQILYYVEVLDALDNVLATLGDVETPHRVRVPAEPKPPASPLPIASTEPAPVKAIVVAPPPTKQARLWPAAVGIGVGALASAGIAVGLNVAAFSEHDALLGRCAPSCTDADLSRLRGEERGAVALYVIAGVAAVAAVVVLAIDLHRRR